MGRNYGIALEEIEGAGSGLGQLSFLLETKQFRVRGGCSSFLSHCSTGTFSPGSSLLYCVQLVLIAHCSTVYSWSWQFTALLCTVGPGSSLLYCVQLVLAAHCSTGTVSPGSSLLCVQSRPSNEAALHSVEGLNIQVVHCSTDLMTGELVG